MNAFVSALGAGYSANKILQYLSKSVPSLAPAIQKAQIAGYGAEKILSFLGESVDGEETKHLSGPQRQARNNFMKGQLVKNAATFIAGGLASRLPDINQQPTSSNAPAAPVPIGAPAAPVVANAGVQPQVAINAAQTAGGPVPAAQQGLVQNLVNRAMPQSQKTIIPPTSQSPVNATNIPQEPNIQQPKENPITNSLWESLEKGKTKSGDFNTDAFLKIARRMKSTGEISSKEDLDKFFGLFSQKMQLGKSLPEALKEAGRDYDKNKFYPKEKEFANMESSGNELDETQEVKGVEKGSLTASPKGLGQVKEIRNGQALIDIDGNLHKVAEDELIQSPIPEKELADLYDDLIGGIEKETEEDVSRMVNFAGYDPNSNTLAFLPHEGGLWLYPDVTDEEKGLLTDILSTRKTSGENFIGAWKAGSKSPIGAALSKFIKDRQNKAGGKGKEYSHKFETVYNYIEPAVKASKKNKRKK